MRTIKFRAWHKHEKKIYRYVEYTTFADGSTGVTMLMDTDGYSFSPNDADVELLQFTGLIDKNGKEVYEGDILQDTHNALRQVVYFADEMHALTGFMLKLIDDPIKNAIGAWHVTYTSWLKCAEIIGNIYENPELLKGKINS